MVADLRIREEQAVVLRGGLRSPSVLLSVNAFCSAGRGRLYFSGLTHTHTTAKPLVCALSVSPYLPQQSVQLLLETNVEN